MKRAIKHLAISGLLGLLLVGLILILPTFASSEDGTRDSITATSLSNQGITMTLAAASGDGHSFTNTGDEFVVVTNDYTATITLTVVTGGTVGGLAIEDVDVGVTVGQTKIVGPFSSNIFNQSDGTIHLDWNSAVTGTVADSVTLAVYEVD